MKHYFATSIALISLTFLLFSSCSNPKTEIDSENSISLEIKNSILENYSETVNHTTSGKQIIVLMGYNFNQPETVAKYRKNFEKKYGLYEDGFEIYQITYPDDFKKGGRRYVSDLSNLLTAEELDIGGVIILGAPEHTHLALARNQDFWKDKVPYPVIAIYPQDDNLGIEATCDIVLDKAQSTEISSEGIEAESESESKEEQDSQLAENSLDLVNRAIDFAKNCDYSFTKGTNMYGYAELIYNNSKLHKYTDPESGLKSINHFILD